MTERPKVGIGVFVLKDNKLLLGKRKGDHGGGLWGGPGGHLELGKSFEECAKRETLEETGIEIANVRFLVLSNLKFESGKHYVDIGLIADWKSGEPTVCEPHKCERWEWFDFNDIPPNEELFGAEALYIEAYKTGLNFKDA